MASYCIFSFQNIRCAALSHAHHYKLKKNIPFPGFELRTLGKNLQFTCSTFWAISLAWDWHLLWASNSEVIHYNSKATNVILSNQNSTLILDFSHCVGDSGEEWKKVWRKAACQGIEEVKKISKFFLPLSYWKPSKISFVMYN